MEMAEEEIWVRRAFIGKGSYGIVYLATSLIDNTPSAIKTSTIDKSLSLQREKYVLEDLLGCPGVIDYYGFSLTGVEGLKPQFYNLVLEYAPGGTLLDLIQRYPGGNIPESDVRGYTRMLLRGLSAIHRKGYVHCDLKPENILVFPDQKRGGLGQLKIADFGLAKVPGEKEQNWRLRFRGTAIYMSPESVGSGVIESCLDIWSLGCVVLEMITGERAWEKITNRDLLISLLRRQAPRIRGNLSEQGKDFLFKCFCWDHTQRWTADMLLMHPFVLEDFCSIPDEYKFLCPGCNYLLKHTHNWALEVANLIK